MSNEIYPLEEWVQYESYRRSVTQRLAPIFRALLNDPEGWIGEHHAEGYWMPVPGFPTTHKALDNFRLVPKRRTITVEIPEEVRLAEHCEYHAGGPAVLIPVPNIAVANRLIEAIRSAMEGK